MGDFFSQLLGRLRLSRVQRREDPVLRNLRLFSRILWLCLAGLGAYVAISLLVEDRQAVRSPTPKPKAGAGASASGADAALNELALPLSEYVASVMQRNPFTGSSEILEQAPQPVTQSAREKLQALAEKLVIVGIDRGPSPEALIEDTNQQRTHFVKVGDQINGLEIKEISDRGVLLGYEGEELLIH
jgi:hypothetical protein